MVCIISKNALCFSALPRVEKERNSFVDEAVLIFHARLHFSAGSFNVILDRRKRSSQTFVDVLRRNAILVFEREMNRHTRALAIFVDLHPTKVMTFVGAPFQTVVLGIAAQVTVAVVLKTVAAALNAHAIFALRLGAFGGGNIFGHIPNVGHEIVNRVAERVDVKRGFKFAGAVRRRGRRTAAG